MNFAADPTSTLPPGNENGSPVGARPSLPLRLLAVGLLVATTIAVFAPATDFPFITMDDPEYLRNPQVQSGLTAEGVRWAFTTLHFANWHPLTWISHMMDIDLFGSDPAGHHLVSVLFHAANGVLLFVALTLMTGEHWKSAFVAFMFALHPLHVESVAWVSERKDVLFAFFLFLALSAYATFARRPGFRAYVAVFSLHALALMAKPMAVTFPFLLLLLDWWPLGRMRDSGGPSPARSGFAPASPARLLAEKVPLLLLSAGSSVVTLLAQSASGAVAEYEVLAPAVRIANMAVSYLRYVGHTLLPIRLSFFYPHPGSSLGWVQPAVSAAVIAAVSLFALSRARRNPAVFSGWFWFLGTLVPVIGLVQVGAQAIADRYTYLPLTGVFIAAAWGIPPLVRRMERGGRALAFLSVAVLAAAAWQTRGQLGYWRSGMSLYARALEVTENNYLMHNNIGVLYEEQGNLDEAIRHYRESVRICPVFGIGRRNLGLALNKNGDVREAISHLTEAVRLEPGFIEAKLTLGVALHRMGRFGEAVRVYEEILSSNPGNLEARRFLENALVSSGGGGHDPSRPGDGVRPSVRTDGHRRPAGE